MSIDKRTMAIWEMEFLKCQTKNTLKAYISKYKDEPQNPFVDKARMKLQSSSYSNIINKTDSESKNTSANSNWFKENADILAKALMFIVVVGLGYIIEEGYSSLKAKRVAETHRSMMASMLRQQEEQNKMMQAWHEQWKESIDKINNRNNTVESSNSYSHNNTSEHQSLYYNPEPFTPFIMNYSEVMTEYNTEIASRQTPQEFLNSHYGSECTTCNGSKKCPACHGTKIASGLGNTYVCNICNDSGDCPTCDGTGLASWNR